MNTDKKNIVTIDFTKTLLRSNGNRTRLQRTGKTTNSINYLLDYTEKDHVRHQTAMCDIINILQIWHLRFRINFVILTIQCLSNQHFFADGVLVSKAIKVGSDVSARNTEQSRLFYMVCIVDIKRNLEDSITILSLNSLNRSPQLGAS